MCLGKLQLGQEERVTVVASRVADKARGQSFLGEVSSLSFKQPQFLRQTLDMVITGCIG